MKKQKMTWSTIQEIGNLSDQELLTKLIYPTLKCDSLYSQTYNSLSQNNFSSFVRGENLELSLKLLNDFFSAITIKKEAPDGTSYDCFCIGKEYTVLFSTINCWNNYDSELQRKHTKDSVEYRDIKKNLENLTDIANWNHEIKFNIPDTSFTIDLHKCMKAIKYDEWDYKLAVYSIIATTWPIWEIASTGDKDNLLKQYNCDLNITLLQLKSLTDAIIPKRITWNTIQEVLIPSCTQLKCITNIIVPPLRACAKSLYSERTTDSDTLKKKNTKRKPTNIFEYNKSSDRNLSWFINGKHSKRSRDYLKIITAPDVVQESHSGSLLNYNEYSYLINVMDTWRSFLKTYPDSKKTLSLLIDSFFSSFENEKWIIRFNCENQHINLIEELRRIKDNTYLCFENKEDLFFYKLSVLSIIATTWTVWEECNDIYSSANDTDTESTITDIYRYRILLKTLVKLIFPKTAIDPVNETVSVNDEYTSISAEQELNKAINLLDNSDDYKTAGAILVDIILHYSSIASNKTLSKTYDRLIECHRRGFNTPPWLGTLKDMEREALLYGSSVIENTSYDIKQTKEKATSIESGLYFIKCSNKKISSWITSTIPTNWKPLTDKQSSSLRNKDENEFPDDSFTKLLTNNIRFILAEDDFEQNVNDALSVLNKFKILTDNDITEPEKWGKIEIVIRCEEEVVSSIIDTACSFLRQTYDDGTPVFECNPIRIHLLDEKKRTADLLYAQHPLFYPLTLPKNADLNTTDTYNLVIISDNQNIDYAVWLIRQAFWLLPHAKKSVASKITVLSPFAQEIADRTTSLCPGFSQFSKIEGITIKTPTKINIDDIDFPEIEYHKIRMNSPDLQCCVEEYITKENLVYYIIDSSSDFNAINLGMRIREISIRKALKKKNLKYYTSDDTIIAIRCYDPDYAYLTKQLIVPKEEEYDNRWFNDYKLIPFGSIKDLFCWNELTGGIIEFMSECIHLQYCTEPGMIYDFKLDAPAKSIWSYYRRFYNRASSYAAAMSLPYRLFEAGVFLKPGEWVFKNKDSFWSKNNRDILADRFNDTIIDESLYRWEHNRFCCYLLSTGWLPASPDETRYYMNNDVSRHTLQIARLHPCLCSWDGLRELDYVLHQAYIGSKDAYGNYIHNEKFKAYKKKDDKHFQKIDIDNIMQTADILQAEPLMPKTKTIDFEHNV